MVRTEDKLNQNVNKEDFKQIHNFFIEDMISPEGGVYTNYKEVEISVEDTITKGHYILSESQGLLMEYALTIDDKELFLKTWEFTKKYMANEDGSFVWRVTPEYEKPNAITSTIDDLQIILQLIRAEEQWNELNGEFQEEIETFVTNFDNYTYWGYLINGYDSESKEQMIELDSSYIYLSALKKLYKYSKSEDIEKIYSSGKNLLDGMYIDHNFPFTHKRFYIETQMIEHREEINMIEALLSALHLSQNGNLNQKTKKWLDKNIDQGIFGYYNLDGEAVSDVESTAIYGIVAQIAYYENDQELYDKAIEKGTKLLQDVIKNPEEEEILSYDNLQLLIAYGLLTDFK